MSVEKRQIDGRDLWFTIERPYDSDPESGELTEADGYFVAFSMSVPSSFNAGEIIKDDQGRARLFKTSELALNAGIKEVKARLAIRNKSYAVGLPGGTKGSEFQAYVALLKAQNVDRDHPRVEDSFGRKWIHVWEHREDAEEFAAQLRELTCNRNWEVYELIPPDQAVGLYNGDSEPIVIHVGHQSDGITYELHPSSRKRLRSKFPSVAIAPSVFLSRDTQTRNAKNFGNPRYEQIVALLTGLDVTRVLDAFGTCQVVDPISNLTLWQPSKQLVEPSV